MSKPNGHANGQANGQGADDGKVTSLDDARKRAAQKAKATKVAALRATGGRSAKDYIYGGLMLAMALGTIAWFVMGLTENVGGGVR